MEWWTRLTVPRRVILVVLLVSLAGLVGSIFWSYPTWPFIFVGCGAVFVNFALVMRDGLKQPVAGRADLDSDEKAT